MTEKLPLALIICVIYISKRDENISSFPNCSRNNWNENLDRTWKDSMTQVCLQKIPPWHHGNFCKN